MGEAGVPVLTFRAILSADFGPLQKGILLYAEVAQKEDWPSLDVALAMEPIPFAMRCTQLAARRYSLQHKAGGIEFECDDLVGGAWTKCSLSAPSAAEGNAFVDALAAWLGLRVSRPGRSTKTPLGIAGQVMLMSNAHGEQTKLTLEGDHELYLNLHGETATFVEKDEAYREGLLLALARALRPPTKKNPTLGVRQRLSADEVLKKLTRGTFVADLVEKVAPQDVASFSAAVAEELERLHESQRAPKSGNYMMSNGPAFLAMLQHERATEFYVRAFAHESLIVRRSILIGLLGIYNSGIGLPGEETMREHLDAEALTKAAWAALPCWQEDEFRREQLLSLIESLRPE